MPVALDTKLSRLANRSGLRIHLGLLGWKEIKQRMDAGAIPGPLWGVDRESPSARWDLRAVDRALDAASSMPATVEQDEAFLDQHLGFSRTARR